MALTPEERRALEEREQFEQRVNDRIAERLSLSSSYNDSIRELLGVQSKRTTFDSNILKINRQINTALYNTRGEFTSISGIQKEVAKNADTIAKANRVVEGIGESIGAQENQRVKDALANNRELASAAEYRKELLGYLEKGESLTPDGKSVALQLKFTEDEIAALDAKNDNLLTGLSHLEKTFLFTQLNADQLQRQNTELAKQAKALGGIGSFAEGFSKIPIIGEAAKASFADVNKSINEGTLDIKNSTAVRAKFFSGLGKGLLKAIGPAAIVLEIIQAIGRADNEITEVAKATAQTKTEATAFRLELSEAANNSGDLFVTATKLVKTFTSLNKQLGFVTNFSAETLVSATKLTEKVGLSAEAAGSLAAASLLNGKSLDDNYKNVLATSYALQRQAGVQFDLREITEAVAKVTGQIRANLGANPAAIADAVTQAKLLGGELDDIKAISSALLDFESSIANELQAELLTGRALNLERARFAALQGDVATVAKEINNQVGDFGTFTRLNVIQQDALASSVGLTSDRLADILFQQEIQGRSARELRALGKDELADRLEATSVQQKFNAAVDKLKGLVADAVTAFNPIIDILSNALSLISLIVKGISSIGLQSTLTGAALGSAFGPYGALIGGVLGAGSDIYRAVTANDAVIPGYGERVMLEEGQITAFNDKDNIVATTNDIKPLQSVQPQVQVTPQVNIDVKGLREDNKMTQRLLTQMLNKEGTVMIDSSTAGRAFTMGTYRMQ